MYVLEPFPVFNPLSFHWYIGETPPFVGVAENVTVSPTQTLVAEAAMVTEGVTELLTVIVIALELTDEGDAQVVDVSVHDIISPFTRDDELIEGEFVPNGRPFFFHA